MKTLLLGSFSLVFATSLAFAATPPINVTITDPGGKVAFKGKTNASGTFSTGTLKPGGYVVQFNSEAAQGNYAIVVSAGKKKVSADSVSGNQFKKGGVALKVDVASGLNITGQVASGGAAGNNPEVKVVNGVKYYKVKGGTGSNLGDRWMTAEEAKAAGLNVGTYSNQAIQSIQEKSFNPQGN